MKRRNTRAEQAQKIEDILGCSAIIMTKRNEFSNDPDTILKGLFLTAVAISVDSGMTLEDIKELITGAWDLAIKIKEEANKEIK